MKLQQRKYIRKKLPQGYIRKKLPQGKVITFKVTNLTT